MKILNVYSLKDTVKTIKRLTDWYKNVCTLYNWQKELCSEKIHVHIFLVEKYISYVYEVYTHTNLEDNIILPYFKIYCKATVIKIVWY